MRSREIERAHWKSFTDSFSRRHAGWLVSLSTPGGAVARDVPLWGVAADVHEHDVCVVAGSTEHVIEVPASIVLDETEKGEEVALTITDDAGARTVIEFRTPMSPELVDGVADSQEGHHELHTTLIW